MKYNSFYFGLGAKTGDSVPDDHDILSFDFYQLNPPPKENYSYRPNEEEIIEREGEFKIDDETLEVYKINYINNIYIYTIIINLTIYKLYY